LQAAVALGLLDHRQRHAILDRATGVLVFQFDEQPAGPVSNWVSSSIGVLPIMSMTECGIAMGNLQDNSV